MKFLKTAVLFYLGGTAYMFLEFLWRGRSHSSMFFFGGLCFLLVGGGGARLSRTPIVLRMLAGSGVITLLELLTGLLVNQDYQIWDYRKQFCQFAGQICLAFSLLWIPLSLLAMELYALADGSLRKKLA